MARDFRMNMGFFYGALYGFLLGFLGNLVVELMFRAFSEKLSPLEARRLLLYTLITVIIGMVC